MQWQPSNPFTMSTMLNHTLTGREKDVRTVVCFESFVLNMKRRPKKVSPQFGNEVPAYLRMEHRKEKKERTHAVQRKLRY